MAQFDVAGLIIVYMYACVGGHVVLQTVKDNFECHWHVFIVYRDELTLFIVYRDELTDASYHFSGLA